VDHEFALFGHHDDQFEQVSCSVWPRQEEPARVIIELDPGDAVFSGMSASSMSCFLADGRIST